MYVYDQSDMESTFRTHETVHDSQKIYFSRFYNLSKILSAGSY